MEKSGGKIFLKILKIFLSIILSGIFLVSAFVFPLYYAVAGIVKPDNIAKVVQNIDYVEILKQSEEFNQAIDKFGIDSNTVDEIIKSDEVGGFIESCADIVTDVIIDETVSAEDFSADTLKSAVNNHADEIAVVLQKKLNKSIKKEEIKDIMNELIDDNSEAIEATVMDLASENTAATAYRTVQKTLSWYAVLIISLINAGILGLIYLLNSKKYSGFIWIAVDSGIVALMLGVTAVILNSNLLAGVIVDMPAAVLSMVASVLGVITSKLIIAVAVLIFIMAASITAVVLLRKRADKKEIIQIEGSETVEESISAE